MRLWTLAIDNAGPYVIRPKTTCRRIEVRENFNSANPPTADLNQFDESDSSGVFGGRVAKGTSAIFTKAVPFSPLDVAGYINTASGSVTLLIIEHEAV